MNPADAVFSALADPTRREVIRRLSEQASMTATEGSDWSRAVFALNVFTRAEPGRTIRSTSGRGGR